MNIETDPTGTLSVSDNAMRRIAEILAEEPAGTMFRIGVAGGGCSGFQYVFDLTVDRNEDDVAIERDGVVVLVDTMSLMYLQGAELDYADELIGAAFRVNNPNATASCGCGTSFSV